MTSAHAHEGVSYIVRAGDWLAEIAARHGTTVGAIWGHPANAGHRAKRGSPDVLYPGDVLFVPVPHVPPPPPPPLLPNSPPEWPYPPFDHRRDGRPTWDCPGGQCRCHPLDGERIPHTIVLHDVFGRRYAGARCRVYEGARLITEEPAQANGRGEVDVEIHPGCSVLRVEWAPENVPKHPGLPYRKHYHVRLGTRASERNARRLANLGFQKQRRASDNIRDYQRAYRQEPTGVHAHVHKQVRSRHDERKLPPFASGARPDTQPALSEDAGHAVRRPQGDAEPRNHLFDGENDEEVDDAPAQGGSTVPNAAHLTVGVSVPPRHPPLASSQVELRLRVKRIAAGVATIVTEDTLLTPDVAQQTKAGAAFLFKHVPEGTYDALAFVTLPSGAATATHCGQLHVAIGTGDQGGHKFVDMTVAPYTLRVVGPPTAIVGKATGIAARDTVGPIVAWASSPPSVGTVAGTSPPLFMSAQYTAHTKGSSVISATDLGGQVAQLTIASDCIASTLVRRRIIASGIDRFLLKSGVRTTRGDSRLPGTHVLVFSNDSLHSKGRKIPHPPEAAQKEPQLKAHMNFLLTVFAHEDKTGMARRLFNAFQAPNRTLDFYEDADLDRICDTHPHIDSFIEATLNAPSRPDFDASRVGIHQRLAAAGFDVNTATPVSGLQPPAVNRGKNPQLAPPAPSTEDRANGLFAMINGFQHAIAVVTDYAFDACQGEYEIELQFIFYDVFGLDDEDMREFGIPGRGFARGAPVTSWWQLQHQFDYVPLITRVTVFRTFKVSTGP